MRLIDPQLLAQYIAQRDITNAQLGRRAGVSRQYIWKLVHNQRTSCMPTKAAAIEQALDLLPGTLFQAESGKSRSKTTKTKVAA